MAKKNEKRNAKYWRDRAIQMEEDKETLARMLSENTRESYVRTFKRLEKYIDALYAEIKDHGKETLTRTDLYNLRKYAALRDKIAKENERLAVKDNKNLEKLLDDIAVGTYKSNLKEMGLDFTSSRNSDATADVVFFPNFTS